MGLDHLLGRQAHRRRWPAGRMWVDLPATATSSSLRQAAVAPKRDDLTRVVRRMPSGCCLLAPLC
jgi:hypothetical protein